MTKKELLLYNGVNERRIIFQVSISDSQGWTLTNHMKI